MENFTPPDGSVQKLMHDLNGQLFVVRALAELLDAELSENAPARAKTAKMLAACEKIAAISTAVTAQAQEKNL